MVYWLCIEMFHAKDQEQTWHLMSLDMRICHSKCNYFVPLWCKLDEEEKKNSSDALAHTFAMDLKREILVKM